MPIALAVAPCSSEDDGGSSDGEQTYSEDDPEFKLASIDAGEVLAPDDRSIRQYAELLDSLTAKCEEGRSLIGDQAGTATQLLADEGIHVTILDALRGMSDSIPDDSPTLRCAEVGAAWVTLESSQ